MKTSVKWQPHCLGLKVLKNIVAKTKCSLFERVCFQRTLFLNLGVVWIQFGAIWINLKTLTVKWRSHCLGLTVLTYCGQFLVVTKSISKFRRNVNKILFSHYRLENGGHISRPQCANTLLLKQNSFYFADDILIYIFEFVSLLHMQLSYLKWIWNHGLQNIGHIVSAWMC